MPFKQFDILKDVPGLAHAIIAKPYNLAPHTGPQRDQALFRRREICSRLGFAVNLLTAPQQIHGIDIERVDTRNAGAGHDSRETAVADCDGLMTNLPRIPLIAFSADCCLLAVVDPQAHAVGLVHAGWRGVADGAGAILVQDLVNTYGAVPGRMLAAIAPAAQVGCYEISDDLASTLTVTTYCGRDVLSRHGDRWHLDMHGALVKQLARAGLPVEQIERSADCTICNDDYYSYRREGPETGRNALLIGWTS